MPSHGGSEFTRFLMNDIPKPRPFCKGMNVKLHLQAVDNYLRQLKVTDDKVKFDILLNTLEENCQYQIFSLIEFDDNTGDPKWLCQTISNLFGEKDTPMNNMMKLLSVKQRPKQKLHDFLAEIRIEAYKIFGRGNKEEREKRMIMAFISGLQSRKASLILQDMRLNTLEECYNFIKDNETDIVEDSIQEEQMNEIYPVNEDYERRIRSLENSVRQLKEKLDQITRNKRTNYEGRLGQRGQRSGNNCYNCGKKGHIARNCYFQQSRRNRVVNNIVDDVEDETRSCEETSVLQSDEDEKLEDVITTVDVTNEDSWSVVKSSRSKSNTKKYLRRQRMDDYKDNSITAWTQYVNGQGGKPKKSLKTGGNINTQYTPTIIHNTSQAKNKALVLCCIEGRATKVLFDSGATQNVISADLFRELSRLRDIEIKKTSRSLKCANNSKLTCLGNAVLDIEIGNTRCRKIFTVVEELSQKAIIGIRGMKASNIVIDARKNGIFCNNEFLKFVGKIASPTVISENL